MEGGGGGGGGQNFRPVSQVFSPCFEGKKQHRNIFLHDTGRLAKFGILENFTQNGGYVVVARSLSIMSGEL